MNELFLALLGISLIAAATIIGGFFEDISRIADALEVIADSYKGEGQHDRVEQWN